jgi:class 3 adenylate cyclase
MPGHVPGGNTGPGEFLIQLMNDKPSQMAGVSAELVALAPSMRVLVVDDSRMLRRVLIRELADMGIVKVVEASDGRAAMDMARSQPFDLMLLDMEMPELDGLGVLRLIKADSALRALPVIMVSAADQLAMIVECIQIGAEDYLPKPFEPILLRARVYSCLEKKRLRDLERERLELLHMEQLKTDKLMMNILPWPVVERLKQGETNISSSYPEVTILFSDMVGFTQMASGLCASELVRLLNNLFTRFDRRCTSLGLEKIKTIGDAYMLVGGLPIPRADHAVQVVEMALGMFDDLAAFNSETSMEMQMRIGLNTGPVVAGVIGFTKFSYDLWGNTVNVASRMESTGVSGRVHVSESTAESLRARGGGAYEIESREPVQCKGLGLVPTFVVGKAKA